MQKQLLAQRRPIAPFGLALAIAATALFTAVAPAHAAPADYRVTLYTGDVESAGTDASVYVRLVGTSGSTHEIPLDNSANNFERNRADTFPIDFRDLGRLRYVEVRHDNTGSGPGWYLDRVRVENRLTGQIWHFPCYQWLAVDALDGRRLARTLPAVVNGRWYQVTVETGDLDYAGTDAFVYLKLTGSRGSTPYMVLDNAAGNHDRGRTDTYSFYLEDLGPLTESIVYQDNTGSGPGWFLNVVTVQNQTAGGEWVFPCYRWLAVDAPDGNHTWRRLYPA